MLKQCPNCGAARTEPQRIRRERHVAGHVFTADLPARVCAGCATTYFDDLVVSQFDALVAARLAEAGVTEPEALKFMRKGTGLQAKEFAELLAVRPETVSRWEQGKRPIDRATYAVMRQLVYEWARGVTATRDYLRSLCRPKRLPKTIKIALPRAA
ncbi:MAG: helix-turn-helix domain-containing protein [Deltaproteobacteria bacterium]|nr:helix-turn-helix domain-containing protein [Deltaproteobacteria bacterium]